MSGRGQGNDQAKDPGAPDADRGAPDDSLLDDGIEREDHVDAGPALWDGQEIQQEIQQEPRQEPQLERQLPLVLGDDDSPVHAATSTDIPEGVAWRFGPDDPPAEPAATVPTPSLVFSPARRRDVNDKTDGGSEADIPIVTVEDEAYVSDPPDTTARAAGSADEQSAPMIIAIASGRGGTGKSLLAANIAVYLAQLGKRVVAVDADPAGGTLNHMLGTPRPGRGFGSFLRGRAETLDELAVDTPVAGVRLVAGETLAFGSPRPKSNGKALLPALRTLSADTIVVDLGPPDSALCLDVWLGAHVPILVTLADPASIEATYRFLKSAFLRRLRGERGLEKLQAQVGRPLPAPLDLYRAALEAGRAGRDEDTTNGFAPALAPALALALALDGGAPARPVTNSAGATRGPNKPPAVAAALAQAMAHFRPRFVVSQTRSLGDTKLGPQMAMAAHRRLGHTFDYLGHVESDETVAAATRRHRPVMAEFPEAKVCRNIEKIVRKIVSAETERPSAASAPRLEAEQTFYEILETEPGVSDEEIRRAFRSCKEIYAVGSPVITGLYDEAELTALHERANAAHDTLFAPERRRLYDLSLPEADLARAVRRASRTPRVDTATPVPVEALSGPAPVDTHADMSGPLLRQIRESRGLELSEIAQRTKIGERHLRAIEDERFDELPAPVYIRGFVTQMARILRIDANRAAETYLRRFHGALGPGGGTPVLKEL